MHIGILYLFYVTKFIQIHATQSEVLKAPQVSLRKEIVQIRLKYTEITIFLTRFIYLSFDY